MKCTCCQSTDIITRPLGLKQYYGCSRCGLVFRLSREKQREDLTHHYAETDPHQLVAVSKQAFFQTALNRLSAYFPGERGKLLDVGCGFGYFLDLAAQKGWDTWGLEIMAGAVREIDNQGKRHNITCSTLKEAQYPDCFFDAATLWDVLVMIENPYDEILECHRILKKGGIIGIRVRNVLFQKMIYRIYSALAPFISILRVKPPYVFHQYSYSPQSLRCLMRRAGFCSVRIRNSPLTKGDPYEYTPIKFFAGLIKSVVDIASRLIYGLSRGKWIIGPSLLVWAEKRDTKITGKP